MLQIHSNTLHLPCSLAVGARATLRATFSPSRAQLSRTPARAAPRAGDSALPPPSAAAARAKLFGAALRRQAS
jgi:hypothetical protein